MSSRKITFVGGGHMTQCLLKGLSEANFNIKNIFVIDRNEDKRKNIEESFKIKCFKEEDIEKVIEESDVIIVAVRPKDVHDTCLKFSEINDKLIISIAAGITCTQLQQLMTNPIPIIRAMPNICVKVKYGATGLFKNNLVKSEDLKLATRIFDSVGITTFIEKEEHMDTITALSGSGPAFFLEFMQSLIEVGQELGLSSESSTNLVLQTALGTSNLAYKCGNIPALIEQIASKGGTTEKGLQTIRTGGIKNLIRETLSASCARAKELSNGEEK